MTNPILQLAFDTFTAVVGSSVGQLLTFVTSNSNIVAIQNLTDQYINQVGQILGM